MFRHSVASRARMAISAVAVTAAVALSPAGTGAAPPPTTAGSPDYAAVPVLSGYDLPLEVVASSEPNRLFIVEQSGRIQVATRPARTAPWQRAGVFLNLHSKVAGPFESHGLLSLAFSPNYRNSGLFYVFYTPRASAMAKAGDILVEEFHRRTDLRADPASGRPVLRLPHSTSFHYGSWMAFGPDGHLYLSIGDSGVVRPTQPQNVRSPFGKILRIDPANPPGPAAYRIPPDNPFVGIPGMDLVWAYGLRNPWRSSFDPQTGLLWIADVGQYRYEEVDRVDPAASGPGHAFNFGWSHCEGRHSYPPGTSPDACTDPGVTLPILEYPHGTSGTDDDCSVIGGFVYRGTAQPALSGRYFYGDFCSGRIWRVPADYVFGDPMAVALDTDLLITSFGTDALGEIYVTDHRGTVSHLVQQ